VVSRIGVVVAETFERAVPLLGQSLARWRHRKDQVELNTQYWISAIQADFLQRKTKTEKETDPVPVDVVGPRPELQRNVGGTILEMRLRAETGARWGRLLTLLLACSALERYMSASATAALESDPLRSAGFPKLLDGLALKKRKLAFPEISLVNLTKGDWSSRLAAFERLFGPPPLSVLNHIGELEKMRKIRNSVAHEFGALESSPTLAPSASIIVGARADRVIAGGAALTERRLIKWLGVLNSVSTELDRHLVANYIGGYEMAAIFLDWKESPDEYEAVVGVKPEGVNRTHDRRFLKFISGALDIGIGPRYIRSMEAYVNRL